MSLITIGPKRPLKRPTPKAIEMINNNVIFIDAADVIQQGTQVFVCSDEKTPVYELLESGSYTQADGNVITVVDGIVQ
tara:strand:- start:3873 stop:4106 length:234 start_codon:yes stop_codon:yes gene_type:complete